jgi:hypothetical protein
LSDDPNQRDEVDRLLDQHERAAKIDAENNYRMMDNHLKHSDRVIANVAALKNLNTDDLIKSVLENPT